MAIDYLKVLNELALDTIVVGRSEESALAFEKNTGYIVTRNGIEAYIDKNNEITRKAIIATGVEQLSKNAISLIKAGVKEILLEKPGGTSINELKEISDYANENNCKIFIAYNRRFYSSVIEAKKIIDEDGGCKSFQFEFTEWSHKIEPLQKKEGVKENWFIGNSTHVVDLAFYLGGNPKEIKCYSSGNLSWHSKSVFSGAGISTLNALFSYHSNWQAPGRWAVEILTDKHRLIFKPLEELQIQKIGSISIDKVELDDNLDKDFKPGLFLQTKKFIEDDFSDLKTLEEQIEDMYWYNQILNGN